jgi:hypothetical protein
VAALVLTRLCMAWTRAILAGRLIGLWILLRPKSPSIVIGSSSAFKALVGQTSEWRVPALLARFCPVRLVLRNLHSGVEIIRSHEQYQT